MNTKESKVTDALGNSYALVIAGTRREYDDFLKATGHDAETYPYISAPEKAFGYYGVKDVLFIGEWYKRVDAPELLKAAESVKSHAEWIEKKHADDERADSVRQMSNEELLKRAQGHLKQNENELWSYDELSARSLASIAASLLVIAREMNVEMNVKEEK